MLRVLFLVLCATSTFAKVYPINQYDINTSSLYVLCSGPHNNAYFTSGTIKVSYDIQCGNVPQLGTSACRATPSNLEVKDLQYYLNDKQYNATLLNTNATLAPIDYALNSEVGQYQHLLPVTAANNETAGILHQCSYDNSKGTLDCTSGLSYILCKK